MSQAAEQRFPGAAGELRRTRAQARQFQRQEVSAGVPLARGIVCVLLAIAAVALAACGGGPETPGEDEQPATAPPLPERPVDFTILDVGGVLSFTKPMIEEYRRTHQDVIGDINYGQAPSTELVSKVRAQQAGGRVDIDLVLSGSDAIGRGIENDVWLKLLPNYEDKLAATRDYTATAEQVLEIGEGQAIVLAAELTGPMLEYDSRKVEDPPQTPEELLEWAKANPKEFTYARPPESGPGRQFLMGLPYLLGDEDPRDPEAGWDKTWEYLKELDKYVAPYPSATSEMISALAQGSISIMPFAAGWDQATRAEGILPDRDKPAFFDGFKWIAGGHYAAVPRGVPDDNLAVVLDLMAYLLQPDQQLRIFATQEKSQPGPAIEGVTIEDAPAGVQRTVRRNTPPELQRKMETVESVPELGAAAQAVMFDRWEREVAG